MGDHEECFVACVVSILIYNRRSSVAPTFLATNAQIARIADFRCPAHPPLWDNTQIERLKQKYVTRPGKPASVFELIREVRKGGRKRSDKVGAPTQYEATGILLFLNSIDSSDNLGTNHFEVVSAETKNALSGGNGYDLAHEASPDAAA
jgi:hypothetical protein